MDLNNATLSKGSIGDELGVSAYTIGNWIKAGLIPPPDSPKGCYSEPAFNFIINKIRNDSSKLSSRANRSLAKEKQMSYLGITDPARKKLLNDLVSDFERSTLSISDGVLALSIAMLNSNGLLTHSTQASRLDNLIESWLAESGNSFAVKKLFSKYYISNQNDDLLGAFYQSIQSISQKSSVGAYYTPKELLGSIKIKHDKTILDPCCGSGGIFLNTLGPNHDTSKIFAGDTDAIALKICLVNLSMFFNNRNIKAVIVQKDIIFDKMYEQSFDYIITNPPWGSFYTEKQKNVITKMYLELETTEVFSIALSNCANLLSAKGKLYFFLPYSFLNVATHRNIRLKILKLSAKISIELLGHAFKGVVSEGILLGIEKKIPGASIDISGRNGEKYVIEKKYIAGPDFFIPAYSNNNDLAIIKQIYKQKHTTLKDDTLFALGIVTGNNDEYLLSKKTRKSEVIFRGKDIQPYAYVEGEHFIEFDAKKYQQVASVDYFRQKKIAYRFISDRLICVLDAGGSLLLNSANLFISNSYPMETVVCLFNSPVYSFLFRKQFHSSKVLKSHLLELPLPVLSQKQHALFASLYANILAQKITQKNIDEVICELFRLNDQQYDYICSCVESKKKKI